MKLAIAILCSLVACGVEPASPTESTEATQEDLAAPPSPEAARPTCSALSLRPCAGKAQGEICSTAPPLRCLPANDAPDGGIICACQAQSTI